MNDRIYRIEVDGTEIEVRGYSIERLYGQPSEIEDVNISRATVIAQRKATMSKCLITATPAFYIGLMSGELATDKPVFFRLYDYKKMWYVTLMLRTDGYFSVYAFNMDSLSDYTRAFTSQEDAILFCANIFNENVAVKNLYGNIESLLNACQTRNDYEDREEVAAKMLESYLNNSCFEYDKFAATICRIHPTLQQNYFRAVKASMLYMASRDRGVDPRNKASHEMCRKLVQTLNETGLPCI